MKKVILLLVTVLAFNLSNAQSELNLSVFQNVDDVHLNTITELEFKSQNNISVTFGTMIDANKDNVFGVNLGLGYTVTVGNISLTPSIIGGVINSKEQTSFKKFYGGDVNLEVKLFKNVSATGKLRYTHEGQTKLTANGFTPNYYVGIKINL